MTRKIDKTIQRQVSRQMMMMMMMMMMIIIMGFHVVQNVVAVAEN